MTELNDFAIYDRGDPTPREPGFGEASPVWLLAPMHRAST